MIGDIETNHVIVVLLMAAFGLIFAAMSEKAFRELKGSCKSAIIRNGWTTIQVLSVCMIIASAGFFFCVSGKNADCYQTLKQGSSGTPYFIIIAIFSAIIMGIGIGMVVDYYSLPQEDIDPCDNKDSNINKQMAIAITVLSGIVFLGCLGYLGWVYFFQFRELPPIQLQRFYQSGHSNRYNSKYY
jgi:cytochrome bd-type quinol oxidase subunit 2